MLLLYHRQRSTMAMASINKLLVTALSVVATMILTSPLCISLSMSHSLKRWRQHPLQRQGSYTRRIIASRCYMIHTADDERETGPTTRRRWRRRRKIDDSIPSTISNRDDGRVVGVDDDDDDDDENGFSLRVENEQPSSNCPIYSMKFPRYRISLTHDLSISLESQKRRMRRLKRGFITKLLAQSSASSSDGGFFDNNNRNFVNKARNGENGNNNHPLGVLSNKLRVWNSRDEILNPLSRNDWRARQTVEPFYHEETMRGRFRWINSSSPSSSSSSDSGKSTTVPSSTIINAPDEDFYAAASFWRMASDITARLASQDGDDIDDDLQQQKMWYLALPETTSTVAQNLCDTLNWYADYTVEQNKNDAGKKLPLLPPLLHAKIDTRVNNGKIPIVQFALHCQTPWQELRQEQLVQQQDQQKLLLPTPDDTERRTKAWVRRVLVHLGICPFTKSDTKSGHGLRDLGVPVANIMYRHSSATMGNFGCGRSSEDVYLLMADTWEAISDMVAAEPTGVSSILLSAPGFDEDFEFFAGPVFAMLETCVSAIQAEEMIGLVCFHPKYVTPDGTSWPGFGHMHSVPRLKQWYSQDIATFPSSSLPSNELTSVSQSLSDDVIAAGGAWQRRTPHSVINVLRAEQLAAAEGRRRTGELYGRNIRVLVGLEGGVGLEKLTEDLKREQCM